MAGRFFTEHDDENAPPVVIINTEAAHQFWPGQDPIGKRIGVNYTGPGRRTDAAPRLREIVGIVGNIRHDALDAPAAPAVYLPYLQDETNHDMATMSLFLRTDGNGMALADSVRNRIHAVDPNQPVQNIQNVADLVSQSVATRRYTLILVSALRRSRTAARGSWSLRGYFLRDFAKDARVRNPDRARGNARTRHVVCLVWQRGAHDSWFVGRCHRSAIFEPFTFQSLVRSKSA